MPNRCVAAGCSNTVKQKGISVFSFPKDKMLKRKWSNQVKRTRVAWRGPTANSVVCSEHFTEDCFDESYKLHQSFGLKKRRRLKDGAVPTIFKKRDGKSCSDDPPSKQIRTAYAKRERHRVCSNANIAHIMSLVFATDRSYKRL